MCCCRVQVDLYAFGHREQPELPGEIAEHALKPDEQSCQLCGGVLETTGKTIEAGEEITAVERDYKLVRHQLAFAAAIAPASRSSRWRRSS